jgi:hypothetical protein
MLSVVILSVLAPTKQGGKWYLGKDQSGKIPGALIFDPPLKYFKQKMLKFHKILFYLKKLTVGAIFKKLLHI